MREDEFGIAQVMTKTRRLSYNFVFLNSFEWICTNAFPNISDLVEFCALFSHS
jgi:hypothetical protein